MAGTLADRAWFGSALVLLGWGVVAWATGGQGALRWSSSDQMVAVWLTTGLLLLGWWRWASTPVDARRWPLASLTLAVSAPLALVPVVGLRGGDASVAGLVASTLAVVPLAMGIATRALDPRSRRRAMVAASLLTVGALVVAWLVGVGEADRDVRAVRWLLLASIPLAPALMVALERLGGGQRSSSVAQRRTLEAFGVVVLGVSPGVAALALTVRDWQPLLLPIGAALVTALVLGRYAVLPLARLAASASGQRDQIVAAAETERQRLAQALHDGPLAEMALLIQRLDRQGDAPAAAIARGVADELRGLGSELRLPILDDLGTGPALEWLVGRITQRSGIAVELRQATTARPPASVELATYRVAQEALVNAVKHGAAPILVSYSAADDHVELVVADGGPGITRDAPARAEREGRLGIAAMAQRAEAIGAHLRLASRPEGGTQVRLEWRSA